MDKNQVSIDFKDYILDIEQKIKNNPNYDHFKDPI